MGAFGQFSAAIGGDGKKAQACRAEDSHAVSMGLTTVPEVTRWL